MNPAHVPAAEDRRSQHLLNVSLSLILLGSIILVYWRAIKYPYVQDDWFVLDSIRTLGGAKYLATMLSARQDIFFRPLGNLYFLAIYKLCYPAPEGFHVAAMLIHFVNSVLVVYVARAITGDRAAAWLTGLLYAVAVTIHMDPLLWMVGIYDLGGAFFFFLSFLLFIRGNIIRSAILYGLALFTKESTIVLLPILFFYQAYRDGATGHILDQIRIYIRRFLWHLAVLACYLFVRILLWRNGQMAPDNPYNYQLIGSHIGENLAFFVQWSIEAINPYFMSLNRYLLIAGFLALIVVIHTKGRMRPEQTFFLSAWIVLGLLPVIYLTHHFYRYYLLYSLPPLIIVLIDGLRSAPGSRQVRRWIVVGAYTLIAGVSAVSAALFVANLDELGAWGPTIPGANNLMRKGTVVRIVQEYLLKNYPVMPTGENLLFDVVPIDAFGISAGPRVWYNDSTLHVYSLQRVKRDHQRLYISLYPKTIEGGIGPDLGKTLLMKFNNGEMRRANDLEDFLKGFPEE